MNGKNIYFASDFHLGAPNLEESREREQRVIRWLTSIQDDAKAIYLLGDLFDFWHEYKTVVPKGFVRFLAKLAELKENGIEIHVFTGNHDIWMYGYFEEELGIPVYHKETKIELSGKRFMIGHGDGLGPGDQTYKVIKSIFRNPFFQFIFKIVHPDIGIWIATQWSKRSREKHKEPERFLGEDQEYLIVYCKEVLEKEHVDFFIFGHRHLPIDFSFEGKESRYINLGEWISQNQYAVFDGNELQLHSFKD